MTATNDDLRRRYAADIEEFFNGKEYLTRRYAYGSIVWVSHHRHVDTLVVEPPEGDQYEIAVRWCEGDEHEMVGYVISDHGLAGYRLDH